MEQAKKENSPKTKPFQNQSCKTKKKEPGRTKKATSPHAPTAKSPETSPAPRFNHPNGPSQLGNPFAESPPPNAAPTGSSSADANRFFWAAWAVKSRENPRRKSGGRSGLRDITNKELSFCLEESCLISSACDNVALLELNIVVQETSLSNLAAV